MDRHTAGTLVEIDGSTTATSCGFATARAAKDGGIIVTETVDLRTFPSWDDFHGKEIFCHDAQMGTIISFVGRPDNIVDTQIGWEYDVYEVFVNKTICHIFAINLKLVDRV